MFSVLQELNKSINKDKPGWQQKFDLEKEKAIKHVEFVCVLYGYQLQQGRHFLHEHPWTAKSWDLPCIKEIMRHPSVDVVHGHMCQFGMTSHIDQRDGPVGPVKKPTGFMTSSYWIRQQLGRRCDGSHDHAQPVPHYIRKDYAKPYAEAYPSRRRRTRSQR